MIQTAFIGDVVLVIPLLKALHDLWPDALLDAMVRPPAESLLETLPFMRDVISYDKYGKDRGLRGFLRQARQLKRRSYDLSLLPHRSLRSGMLAWLAKIPRRIGFNRGGGKFFHTDKVDYPSDLHEIERNISLLQPLGVKPEIAPPLVLSTGDDVKRVDEFVGGHTRLIALAPGSVWFSKRWPEDNYIELGKILIKDDWGILLIGGSVDSSLCQNIANAIGGNTLNGAGQFTLRQSVEALRRCEALVTNDSAPTHLGLAANTRVFTIFGSTAPQFGFFPYGEKGKSLQIDLYCRPCTNHGKRNCPEKHFRCLKDLTPGLVYQQLQQVLP
ncbi:lipopolysaccharide heptosyltransferase II [bacterium]|nr:lipopolysaccharide heptosyltransferase II [bacterium]MBU1882028.1 lipopolysaccharide heptosyltransferase II [bacterium]